MRMKNKTMKSSKNNNFLKFFRKIGTIRYIFIIYILFTIIISLLLYWNISHNKGVKQIKYIDALFVAASAFSDTGLTTLTIANTFNEFGQILIAISMVAGGIGIFTIKIYIFQTIFGFKSSIFSNMASQTERGSSSVSETRKMIKVAISFLIITTIIASFIFTMLLYLKDNNLQPIKNALSDPQIKIQKIPHGNFPQALKLGIFHAISSVNNAGFDLFGKDSLQPFYFDYAFQSVTIIVFLLGGVGFPVIYDVWKRIQAARENKSIHRFQLFTKFTIITFIITTIIGFGLSTIIEYTSKDPNSFWSKKEYGSDGDKIFAIFFQVNSTRSAGFATVNYYEFNQSTILLHGILMFIGFSPVSTAGGIRNTTIAVIFLSVVTMLTNKKRINAFKRQISKETLIRAVNVFTLATLLVIVVTIINYSTLPTTSSKKDMIFALFEACSAFGNTGLTTGLTADMNLHIAGKISLIFLMIIGQFGIPQAIKFFGRDKEKPEHYQYVYEDVSIG